MWLGHDSFASADDSAADRDGQLSLLHVANLQRAVDDLARMAADLHRIEDRDSFDAGDAERAAS